MYDDKIVSIMRACNIDLVASLPCDKARDLFFLLPEKFPHIGLTREEDGVGVCAGAYLAGGRPAMVIQSSGLGNMLNALLSLTRTYTLPLPIIASWRGIYKESIPAQIPFNSALPEILTAAGIPYLPINTFEELDQIGDVIDLAYSGQTPAVALLSPACFVGDRASGRTMVAESPGRNTGFFESPHPSRTGDLPMTRYDAIHTISGTLGEEAVIGNIGVPSKELFACRDRDLNFYMLGSYTQASPVGLGVSMKTNREVFVIDGDGSILGTGILPVIGSCGPENLTIFCLDNGTFGSTGNQPTPASGTADLQLLARAAGIRYTRRADSPETLLDAIAERKLCRGPAFIHVPIKPGNADVPQIPLEPRAIRDRFMSAVSRSAAMK